MKKTLYLLVLAICAALFAGCGADSGVSATGLRCEYMADPLGIGTGTPRFGWTLEDAAKTRGQRQTTYRIIVSSTPRLAAKGKGDLWDSRTVRSGESVNVPYTGPELASGQECYWRVMVGDMEGRESAWSRVARFSVGLLERTDWQGEWIAHPSAKAEKHIWFRKNIDLDAEAGSAFIYVASLGYHELYVNGEKADLRMLAPNLTRIDKRLLYVTYDVAHLLKKGGNTIALWYGPGWSRYDFFHESVNPALLVQMNGSTRPGKAFSLHSDGSWKCAESNSFNSGRFGYSDMGGELVDGQRHCPDWNKAGFDDSAWEQAAIITPLKGGGEPLLSAHMSDRSVVIETLAAQSVADTIPGIYKADMGKNFTGLLEIAFRGMAAGDTVVITVADDPISLHEFGQREIYICRGEDGEKFTNRLNYTAGRYVNIKGLKNPPALADIKGHVVSSAPQRTGRFECSDDMLNRIYETDLWTYEMCHTEGFCADCPHRERMGYGEVTGATAWGISLPNYDVAAFNVKHVRDWADVQEASGWIHHTAPQINNHYGGVMWSSAGLNLAWEHYLTYTDAQILELTYEPSRRWLEFLNDHSSDGLLRPYAGGGRFLGDWAGPGARKEFGDTRESLFFNNCAYTMNLATFVRIAQILGKEEDAALYSGRLEDLRARIHSEFYDDEAGVYMHGNQVQTAFPVITGIATGSVAADQTAHFMQDIAGPHPYLDYGSPSLYVVLRFLLENPCYHDIVSEILAKTDFPGYGHFLASGETTWPEYWEVDVPSKIHTCYTGIAGWFVKGLAGINYDTEAPGYRSFVINPQVAGNLEYAGAEIPSPYGTIKSKWRKKDGRTIYELTVPVGTEATVSLPCGDGTVTESGTDWSRAEGVTATGAANGRATARVSAGEYKFETTN